MQMSIDKGVLKTCSKTPHPTTAAEKQNDCGHQHFEAHPYKYDHNLLDYTVLTRVEE